MRTEQETVNPSPNKSSSPCIFSYKLLAPLKIGGDRVDATAREAVYLCERAIEEKKKASDFRVSRKRKTCSAAKKARV